MSGSAPRPDGGGRRLCVLQVVDDLGRGGAQSVVHALVRLRDRDRFRMEVASVTPRRDARFAERIRADSDGLRMIGARGLWDLGAVMSLARLIRERDVDVVHTHLASADVLGGLAGRVTGRPVVTTLHSVAADRQTHPGPRRLLTDIATRRLADERVAVSEAVRSSIAARLHVDPSRVRVIRNVSIAPALLPEGLTREAARARLGLGGEPLICMAARMERPKDHDTLLRALARLRAEHPGATLLLAGDGARRPELEALAEGLELGAAARFLGVRGDVAELLVAADVVCNLTFEQEGLSITVLDAMALGRPVVASHIPSVEEVIRDGCNGLLVAPRDVEGARAALAGLLADPVLRERIGRRASEDLRQTSDPGAWMREYERLYVALRAR